MPKLVAVLALVACVGAARPREPKPALKFFSYPYTSGQGSAAAPGIRPSDTFLEYRDSQFRFSYPENWRTYGDKDSAGVTVAPPQALQTLASGATNIGYGAVIRFFYPERKDLRKATKELIERLRASNPSLRQTDTGAKSKVAGRKALLTTLHSDSQYSGQTEIDRLVTVDHPSGLFYIVFIAPEKDFANLQQVFEKMLASVRFSP